MFLLHYQQNFLTTIQSRFKLKLLPQHYKPIFFGMLHHPNDTSSFKTTVFRKGAAEAL